MRRFIRAAAAAYEGLAVAFLLALSLSVAAQIVLRNLFNAGSAVLEELARFSLVSAVFLMIPALSAGKQQIVVDIVLMRLKPRARRIFDFWIGTACAAFGVFVLYSISLIMQRNWSVRTPAMHMSNAVFYIPIVMGIAFFTLVSIHDMVRAATGGEDGK